MTTGDAVMDRLLGVAAVSGQRFRLAVVARVLGTATDTDWSVGEGPEIRGPVLALLLLLTGRPVVLPQLEGPGATALAERLKADGTRR